MTVVDIEDVSITLATADRVTHPDLGRVARFLPGPMSPTTLRRVARIERSLGPLAKDPSDVEVVDGGSWSLRLHLPSGSGTSRPALLWIHGGGYVIGRAAQDDRLCRLLARALGIVVAAVDYRLAPDHAYPAPLDDCHDALVWLAAHDAVDADRIAIGGASAGGGLAAGLAIAARDRGVVSPVLQLLTYPMLDDRTALRDDVDETGFRLWGNRANHYGWRSYLGADPGATDVADAAAAGRCDDLSGLPPAWIGVGTLDLFLDEDLAYARRLVDAGVSCELDMVEGAFHGFDSVVPRAGVSRDFCESQARALVRAFRGVGV